MCKRELNSKSLLNFFPGLFNKKLIYEYSLKCLLEATALNLFEVVFSF